MGTNRLWNRLMKKGIGAVTAMLLGQPLMAVENVGTGFTYQGQLTDGAALAHAAYDFEFRLFDDDIGGIQLGGTLTRSDLLVSDGLFTTELDFGGQYNGDARWLEIRVRLGTSNGAYTTLTPRQKLSAAPYSLGLRLPLAQTVNTSSDAINLVQGVTGTGDVAQFEITNPNNSGEAVEGRTNGSGDAVQAVNTGTGRAGYFEVSNPLNEDNAVRILSNGGSTGRSLYVTHSGLGDNGYFEITNPDSLGEAVEARSNGIGDAVQAVNTGTGRAGHFEVDNPLSGANTLTAVSNGTSAGKNIYAQSLGAGDNGYFEILNPDSLGEALEARTNGGGETIRAINTGDGWAGYFESNAYGLVSNTFSETPGEAAVWGEVLGTTDWGNYGVAGENQLGTFDTFGYLGGGNVGAYGECYDGTLSYGTLGDCFSAVQGTNEHPNGTGVHGIAHAGSSAYAIWGESDEGDAGHFSGNTSVTGVAYESAGAVRIDHPLDPENKVLNHSTVISPDMMTIQNGSVVTDANGFAVVTLPKWFDALNSDFRYQLTVVDEANDDEFIMAKVARKISDNRFTIRTSVPGVEVSWMVTGIRRDEMAQAHRIQVEEEKSPEQRGRYIRPELFGQPKSMRMEEALKPVAAAPEGDAKLEDGRANRASRERADEEAVAVGPAHADAAETVDTDTAEAADAGTVDETATVAAEILEMVDAE